MQYSEPSHTPLNSGPPNSSPQPEASSRIYPDSIQTGASEQNYLEMLDTPGLSINRNAESLRIAARNIFPSDTWKRFDSISEQVPVRLFCKEVDGTIRIQALQGEVHVQKTESGKLAQEFRDQFPLKMLESIGTPKSLTDRCLLFAFGVMTEAMMWSLRKVRPEERVESGIGTEYRKGNTIDLEPEGRNLTPSERIFLTTLLGCMALQLTQYSLGAASVGLFCGAIFKASLLPTAILSTECAVAAFAAKSLLMFSSYVAQWTLVPKEQRKFSYSRVERDRLFVGDIGHHRSALMTDGINNYWSEPREQNAAVGVMGMEHVPQVADKLLKTGWTEIQLDSDKPFNIESEI